MATTSADDYPRTRAQAQCPTCTKGKDWACLVCWACFRHLSMRDGIKPEIRRRLEAFEAQLTHAGADQARQVADARNREAATVLRRFVVPDQPAATMIRLALHIVDLEAQKGPRRR